MKLISQLRSDSGNALIAILIAGAILGVMITGLMNYVDQANQTQGGIAFRQQTDWLHGEIRGLLSNPQACLNNFAGTSIDATTSVSSAALRDGGLPAPGAVKYDLTTNYGDRTVRIVSFNLASPPDPQWYTSGTTQANLILTITYQPIANVIGAQRLVRTVEITADKGTTGNSPGTLAACSAKGAAGVGSQWVSNGDDIHYPLGGVGIGTASPNTLFHIRSNGGESGNITAVEIDNSGAGGARWGVGVGNSASTFAGQFLILDYAAANNPRLRINGSGNIGIGGPPGGAQLTVNGQTQLSGRLDVSGRTDISNNLTVTGDSTFQRDLQVSGVLNAGYSINTCSGGSNCSASCGGSHRVIAGGCRCPGGLVRASHPQGNTSWRCNCVMESSNPGSPSADGWAICMRVR